MTEPEERARAELVAAARPHKPWDQLSDAEQEDFARAVYRQIAEGITRSRAQREAARAKREAERGEPES